MDLNFSFLAGIGCGICIGASLLTLRRYFGDATKVVKRFSSSEEYKLVLVVRTDLGMGKGKMAAQCSHAAVGAFEKSQKKEPEALQLWQATGQAKVAVKIDNVEDMKALCAKAKKLGLITSLIRDAGRTQISSNTLTVLGIGPAPKSVIDQVTGHLKLL